jgi:hypothetical protein
MYMKLGRPKDSNRFVWREDMRRVDNGAQVKGVAFLAMKAKPSVNFCGYRQRSRVAA